MKALIGICAKGDIQKEFDGLIRSKEMYKIYKNRAMTQQCESKIKTEYRTERKTPAKQGGGRKHMYYNGLDRNLVIAQQ